MNYVACQLSSHEKIKKIFSLQIINLSIMENLCRTCAKSSDQALASIFLETRFTLKYVDMIKECTSVNVSSYQFSL